MRSDYGTFHIRLLKRPHKFFIYFQGQPEEHVMDWSGCNFRVVRAEGQPKGGFETPWDAWLWAEERPLKEIQEEVEGKAGTHLSENKEYYEWQIHYPNGHTPVFEGKCPLDECSIHTDLVTHRYPPDEWLEKYKIHSLRKQRERNKEES